MIIPEYKEANTIPIVFVVGNMNSLIFFIWFNILILYYMFNERYFSFMYLELISSVNTL